MIASLFSLVVWMLVFGILYILVDWLIKTLPVPDPAGRIIRIVLVVIICLVFIGLLLNMLGVSTGVDLPKLGYIGSVFRYS